MAGTINKQALRKAVLESAEVKKEILKIAQDIVDKEKNELINNFKEHPVTKEIANGENASNVSGTLGGYGNLFSFIGFSNTADPISPILNLLNKISIRKKVEIKNNIATVSVVFPSKDDIANVSKMPWESGRSWLWDVEKSISGIGAYLFGKFEKSRSGSGIQLRKSFTGKTFTRVSYFTPLYKNFIRKLGGKLK